MAFGGKAPTAPKSKPPLAKPQLIDGFDKKEWVKEFRLLKKEIGYEERDKYRPLLCIKRDMQDFIIECEKIEKQDQINLRREEDQ